LSHALVLRGPHISRSPTPPRSLESLRLGESHVNDLPFYLLHWFSLLYFTLLHLTVSLSLSLFRRSDTRSWSRSRSPFFFWLVYMAFILVFAGRRLAFQKGSGSVFFLFLGCSLGRSVDQFGTHLCLLGLSHALCFSLLAYDSA
jgi:hypothetical protein